MSLPVISKHVGINPNPCGADGQVVSASERVNWANVRKWENELLNLLIDTGGAVIDDATGDLHLHDGDAMYGILQNTVIKFRLLATLTRVSDGGTGQALIQLQRWNRSANPPLGQESGDWEDGMRVDANGATIADPQITGIDYFDHWSGVTGDEGWCRLLTPLNDSLGQPSGITSGQAAAIIWMKSEDEETPALPDIAHVVQVNHSGGTAGHLKEPNASNYHPGRIVTFVDGTKANGADIWILFVDHYDTDAGDVIAEQGRFYGPARKAGEATVSADTRPLYVCHVSEHQFLAQATGAVTKGNSENFTLYHSSTETSSGITVNAQCKFNAYTANKWAIVTRINGQYYANQVEC